MYPNIISTINSEKAFIDLKEKIANKEHSAYFNIIKLLEPKAEDMWQKNHRNCNNVFSSTEEMLDMFISDFQDQLTKRKKNNIRNLQNINELKSYFNHQLDRFCKNIQNCYAGYKDEYKKSLTKDDKKKGYEKDIVNNSFREEERNFTVEDKSAKIPGKDKLDELDVELRKVYNEIYKYIQDLIKKIKNPQLQNKLESLNKVYSDIDNDTLCIGNNNKYTLLLLERIQFLKCMLNEFTTRDDSGILPISSKACMNLIPFLNKATADLTVNGKTCFSRCLEISWSNSLDWCEKHKTKIIINSEVYFDYYFAEEKKHRDGILNNDTELFRLVFSYNKFSFDFAHYKSSARSKVVKHLESRFSPAYIDDLFAHWRATGNK